MAGLHDVTRAERPRNWVGALRDFAFAAPTRAESERCELCGQPLAAHHPHLIEVASHRLACACAPCADRFDDGTTAYRRVPEDVCRLDDFRISDAEWDALLIPIGLAFFFKSTRSARVVAMYPGPAGAVESQLDLEAWQSLAAANPLLDTLRADVEALLVHRIDGTRAYWLMPIDRCYALAGLIRKHWHGLSGGPAVRDAIDRFFADFSSAEVPRALTAGHA